MKKVAVVLSGCGVYDGAEIHESVLTLLALSKRNIPYECLAPNIKQMHVMNHLTGEVSNEERNVLVESARIARGDIKDLSEVEASDYSAVIFPGGFGAAKNLSDFATSGVNCKVESNTLAFTKAAVSENKPLAFLCIAPALIPHIINDPKVHFTIGTDPETAKQIESVGGRHQDCSVTNIVLDENNQVVSTPAYMLAQNISEAAEGIDKCVEALAGMVRAS